MKEKKEETQTLELIEAEAGSSIRLRNPDNLGFLGLLVKIASVFLALFALWYNSFGVISELHQNAIFFSLIGFVGFILYPLSKKRARQTLPIDTFLAFLVLHFSYGVGSIVGIFRVIKEKLNERK